MAITRKQHTLLNLMTGEARKLVVIGLPAKDVQALLDERPRLVTTTPGLAVDHRGNLQAAKILFLTDKGRETAGIPF